MDGNVNAPTIPNLPRGYGGVAIVINPLLPYQIVSKYTSPNIQYISARIQDTVVTTIYMSPRASSMEVTECLGRLDRLGGNRAIIMRDLNCRHTRWDSICNSRGRTVIRWADKNRWDVTGPDSPSFVSPKGTSSPDIFLLKGMDKTRAKTWAHMTESGSDHFPVVLNSPLHAVAPRKRTGGSIPRKQRSNPTILEAARKEFAHTLPPCLETIEEAETTEQLEAAYERFKQTLLSPWNHTRRKKPGRFKQFWNDTLDAMGKLRRKLYRRALTSGTTSDWNAYRDMDKRIKRHVKDIKRRQRERLCNDLAAGAQKKIPKEVQNTLTRDGQRQDLQNELLDPDSFTNHMETAATLRWSPQITHMTVDEDWRKQIEAAIKRAPRKKASGIDDLFVEALAIDSKITSMAISCLWQKCLQLKHNLLDWSTAVMVPLFKKGDPLAPESYRPIALLSHARKVIEAAIAVVIRQKYTFSDCQLGFRTGTNTETAIVGHMANCKHLRWTAVLDLKSAYDSVPRKVLMEVAARRLESDVLSAIRFALQPVHIKTIGTTTGKTGIIAKGVCQGSPLSPTLFNIYMDTLPNRLGKNNGTTQMETTCIFPTAPEPGPRPAWNLTMFADDVKVQAVNSRILQERLVEASDWAVRHGLT